MIAKEAEPEAFGGRARWRALAFSALALVGLGISAYLTAAHYEQFTLACAANSVVNCASVTHSAYAQLPGTSIPVSAAGLLWFTVALMFGALPLRFRASGSRALPLRLATSIWSVGGMAFVLYLVYVELVLVHRLCEWCTAVHLTVFIMLLLSLVEWQDTDSWSQAEEAAVN